MGLIDHVIWAFATGAFEERIATFSNENDGCYVLSHVLSAFSHLIVFNSSVR